tara:strand:+ start:12010 stop:12252 length:243 start_codon:yes stop_codon:yes gene_type:complete
MQGGWTFGLPSLHLYLRIDNTMLQKFEKKINDIKIEMDWCRQDIEAGIDYDYSQDRADVLERELEEVRLDLAVFNRRQGL